LLITIRERQTDKRTRLTENHIDRKPHRQRTTQAVNPTDREPHRQRTTQIDNQTVDMARFIFHSFIHSFIRPFL